MSRLTGPSRLLHLLRQRLAPAPAASADTGRIFGRYAGRGWVRRYRKTLFLILAVLGFVYGFAFALLGPFFLPQFISPLILLAALLLWILPETDRPPERLLSVLLLIFTVILCCWPEYLAVALPGLPWITAMRLVGGPMAITMLLCLTLSPSFRDRMKAVMSVSPAIWKMMVVFAVMTVITIPFSRYPTASLSRVVLLHLTWTGGFVTACYVLSKPGWARRFAITLFGSTVVVCLIALYEARYSQLPWVGRIPWFLAVQTESVQNILQGSSRSATGIYRVQSKFTTPLNLGEFLGLTAPFIVHFLLNSRNLLVRLAALVLLPTMFYVIVKTDSRLAVIGFLLTFVLYVLVWGAQRWRRNRESLFGPAVVFSYPLFFAIFIAATLVIGRLRTMVWGGGATSASTTSRKAMFQTGLPKVAQNPIGHGMGESAGVVGFRNPAGEPSIDSYVLSALLDFGVVGFVAFFGVFIMGIWLAGKATLRARDTEILLLAPAAISMVNFLVSKTVLSQVDTHALPFMVLGMTMALLWRQRLAEENMPQLAAPVRPVQPPAARPLITIYKK